MEKLMRIVRFSATIPDTANEQVAQYVIQKQLRHYSRAELSQKLKISLRDIRNLVIANSIVEPKEGNIIVSFGDVSAIISADSLYLLFEEGSVEDFYQSFDQLFFGVLELERQTPFERAWELLCLETVLYYQVSKLSKQLKKAKSLAERAMEEAETAVGQAKLAQHQQMLTQLHTDCTKAATTLEALLDDDEAVAQLSFQNRSEERFDPEAIADMVESYLFQIRSLTLEASETLNLIQNKIELAELNLDHNRNTLMTYELKITFLTAALDLCCMFAGLFGMNVVIPWNGIDGAWWAVTAGILVISAIFYVIMAWTERAMERKK